MKKFRIYINESNVRMNVRDDMISYLLSQGVDIDEFLWALLNLDYESWKIGDDDDETFKDIIDSEFYDLVLNDAKLGAEYAFKFFYNSVKNRPIPEKDLMQIYKALDDDKIALNIFNLIYEDLNGFESIVHSLRPVIKARTQN